MSKLSDPVDAAKMVKPPAPVKVAVAAPEPAPPEEAPAAPAVAPPPPKKWVVRATKVASYKGQICTFPAGKVIDESSYNVAWLRDAGVLLDLLDPA